MSECVLRVTDLTIDRGGRWVLHVPELAIHAGEFLSIIGPNGAGKSTLLLGMAGLLERRTGLLTFHGVPLDTASRLMEYRRRIAVVFQEPFLFDATVFENVESGLKIRGMARWRAKKKVEENLELFGIAHLASRSARKLSGGEAQRTSLARAFATDPEIVYLDEPFSSLDPPTKESMLVDIVRAMRARGTAAVMATHDRMDALRLSHRMAVMDAGRIMQIDEPFEVMHRPVNETVAAFVGIETVLEGEVREASRGMMAVGIDHCRVFAVGDLEPGEKVVCMIHPSSVTLSPSGSQQPSSARNTFAGRVTRIQSLGLLFRVEVDCGFPLTAHLTHQALEDLYLDVDKDVTVSFKASSVHVVRSGTR